MEWFQVFESDNIIETNVTKGLLESENIEVQHRGEALQSAIGELPPTDTSSLWVSESQVKRAQKILATQQALAANTDNEWQCSNCHEQNPGNFQQCWSCQEGESIGSA